MGRLIYSMSVSLDGFVESPSRSIDWVHVDEELHSCFNDEARAMRAFLYGRRMYELMTGYWPTAGSDPAATTAEVDFARIWKDMPKVVFSTTLTDVGWNSRLVRDGAVGEVARLKAQSGFDMGVGGPTLAATLIQAGLVDEYRLYVNPVILGGGLPFFPALEAPEDLRLVETRQFGGGVVFLRYEAARLAAEAEVSEIIPIAVSGDTDHDSIKEVLSAMPDIGLDDDFVLMRDMPSDTRSAAETTAEPIRPPVTPFSAIRDKRHPPAEWSVDSTDLLLEDRGSRVSKTEQL